MTTTEIKAKGVLYASDLDAEMYLVIGKWNTSIKKPACHWYMISPNTGTHSIITNSNRADERVNSHWSGFVNAQKEYR
ncbi:hypothetical protein [Mucilaginibacter sp.]|uniref:hypothetical protein n=1 Tax=Mucilaginibacter sp. TaxID=1882438 RepID=UPI0026149096|nr:hypothetical protein [Mucilaginibacter sp.]MDB5032238.1 hypothetical protein [Mucilaginibacter sp.]